MTGAVYLVIFLVTILASIYLVVIFFSHTPRKETSSELNYTTNDDGSKTHQLSRRITSTDIATGEDSLLDISVVVPCYNETKRLGKMLDECVLYLETNHKGRYEIIIVDDGSQDHTAEFAIKKANELKIRPHVLKVVKLSKNRGKGGAVTHGLLHASGKLALFADADGATKFSDVGKMIPYFANNPEVPKVAIGSRAHMVNTDAVVKRSFIRNCLMYGLHTLVYVFGIQDVQDTQCGFKLFNKSAISKIFPHMHTERWIFDVEVLLLAEMQKIQIKEFAVNWVEIDGSKVDLARDSIGMAIDLVVTRLAYLFGIYKLDKCKKLGKKNQ